MLCIGMLLLLVGSTFMARFLAGMECGELSFFLLVKETC